MIFKPANSFLLLIVTILTLNVCALVTKINQVEIKNKNHQDQVAQSFMEIATTVYDTTPTPTKSSGVVINIPEIQDPITRNLKLYLIIIGCCVALCGICAFCYFCADRLLPVLAFLEHFIFYTVKLIILPYQCFIISMKFICYPVKEVFYKCTSCCNNHYRPWSRTT